MTVPVGGMYQEWMSLIDLVEEDTARKLKSSALENGLPKTKINAN